MKQAAIAVCLMLCLCGPALSQASKGGTKAASSSSGLEAKIRQAWDAFKNQDKNAYGALLSDDATQVWADNKPPRDKAAALRDMTDIKLDSYTLSNMKIAALGPDAAMATYQAKVRLTLGGQKMSPMLAVTDIWVKRGGEWKSLRYQESEIK